MVLAIPGDPSTTPAATEAPLANPATSGSMVFASEVASGAPVGNGAPSAMDDGVNQKAREKRHLSRQQQLDQQGSLPPIRQR